MGVGGFMATMYVPETSHGGGGGGIGYKTHQKNIKNIHLYANARKIMVCHCELCNCFEYLDCKILVIQLHSIMTLALI